MAFSFRSGINWYHDFPKLARDSGFYFNMNKNKVRIDWNRLAGIDIERVIQDRNFSIIDENINSVIDYNLDSEYDVKILDPNFVKLFKLSQLSVEYLLYCKQYLDHSVVILKDELRSKIDENVKLKKELVLADEDLGLLKDKLKNKYKSFEKMYSEISNETQKKDVYKCPYCKKTFASAICTSYHIGRRHSNSSQISSSSPVHEQSKTEKEKLQDEIKNLKEKLNQTERIISNEAEKSPRNLKSNEKNYENQNVEIQGNDVNKDNILEEVHKKHQEEMNNLKAMLFNEIQNLREDEKKSSHLDNKNEKLKELLKRQENEIHQLTDQIQKLSLQQSIPNLEMIQSKLISQEEYWKSKIDQIEFQHTKDIEELSMQLKITQELAEKMRNDYLMNIKKLEEKSKNCSDNVQSVTKPFIIPRQCEEDKLNEKNSFNDKKEKNISFFSEKYHPINDKNEVSAGSTDLSEKIEIDLSNRQNQSHLASNYVDSSEKHLLDETKPKSQSIHTKVRSDEKKIDYTLSKQHNRIKENSEEKVNKKIDFLSSQSAESESESGSSSISEDTGESQSTESPNFSSQKFTESDPDESVKSSKNSIKEIDNFKQKVLNGLEQKLLDLGVDIEMDGISKPTYQRLISIVKHHRHISSKKYQSLEEIRRNIINKINKKFFNQKQKKKKVRVYNTPTKTQLKRSLSDDRLKIKSSSDIKSHPNTQKIKFEKANFIRHYLNENNHELLPMKLTHQKFQDLNNPRLTSMKLKQDESNKKVLLLNDKKKSCSRVVSNDSVQDSFNFKKTSSSSKHEDTNRIKDFEKHKVIFSSKSLKPDDKNKDEIDIVSINNDDDDDDDDDDDHHHHHSKVKIYEQFNKFPQPAPRITKENALETLQSVK